MTGGGSMLAGEAEEMVPQHVAPAACIQISWKESAQAQTLVTLDHARDTLSTC